MDGVLLRTEDLWYVVTTSSRTNYTVSLYDLYDFLTLHFSSQLLGESRENHEEDHPVE